MPQTFTKSERLCSKKILGELFKKGSPSVQTFYLFPFRVLYLPHQSVGPPPSPPEPTSNAPSTLQPALPAVVITVPKRTFKRAVARNLIRRRVREAYRLNKALLVTDKTTPAYIAFLYTAKQIISFEEIEKGMKLALQKL